MFRIIVMKTCERLNKQSISIHLDIVRNYSCVEETTSKGKEHEVKVLNNKNFFKQVQKCIKKEANSYKTVKVNDKSYLIEQRRNLVLSYQ